VAYVIKEWFASETPNRDDVHVYITGREGGLISFLLSLIGIDPTVTLIVDKHVVRFQKGSWSGFFQSVTPLENVCSTGYGYAKPWKAAVLIAILGSFTFVLAPLFWIGAIVYYFLNKQLKLELWDLGGRSYAIDFKRSVIENKNIDEKEAGRVNAIIDQLCTAPKWSKQAPTTPQPSPQGSQHASIARTPAEADRTSRPASASSVAVAAQASGTRTSTPLAQPAAGAPAPTSAHLAACPRCRAPISTSDGFCGACGAKLS
jgi:hypothetical protein